MSDSTPRRVLNVGGGTKAIPLPPHYAGWEHLLLDIDPRGAPDVVLDARELATLPPAQFDAVYCSHNLEHYHRHHAVKVLQGFAHILKPEGFAEILVPDLAMLMRTVVERNLDVDDFLYQSPAGPILVRDVIYGYGVEIERSGQDFFAHRTGFSVKSLMGLMQAQGFPLVFAGTGDLQIRALGFKRRPEPEIAALLNLPALPK
jgi:SAM-dependent methyltransferase